MTSHFSSSLSANTEELQEDFEVSVVIPIKDENDPYIDQCRTSLRNMSYATSLIDLRYFHAISSKIIAKFVPK